MPRHGTRLTLTALLALAGGAQAATVCSDGAPATVEDTNCTVDGVTTPTTVTFSGTVTGGSLILNGQAPTGNILTETLGLGDVVVSGSSSTVATIGIAGAGAINSISVNDLTTLTLGASAAANTVTVGQGSSGALIQNAGTVTTNSLVINDGASYTLNTGVLNGGVITIGSGGSLTGDLIHYTTIDGIAAGQGSVTFQGNHNTEGALGGSNALAAITTTDGFTFTLDENASTTTFNANGTVNQTAGTLTAGTLAIGAGDSFTQSGSGVINATNTTIDTGGTLTLINQGSGAIDGASAGTGALVFGGNYDTDSALGGANALSSITVNNGTTLTLDQAAAATSFVFAGVVNKSGAASITGDTTVQDTGTLSVAADFTNTGNLAVGSGTGGTLSIGTSTLTVGGTFDLGTGATFNSTISSATTDDAGRVVATGIATVDAGSTINLTVTTSAIGSTYKIIDGGLGGSVAIPTTIVDNSALLDFIASTDGDDLTVTAVTSAAAAGLSSNAKAVNTALSALTAADSALDTAFAGISTTAELNAALESLAPNMSGAAFSASHAAMDAALFTVDNRLADLRTGSGRFTGLASGDGYRDVSFWVQGFGKLMDQDDRDNVSGYEADTAGAAFGADTQVKDGLRMGAAVSYAKTNADTNNASSSLDIDSYQLSVYGSYERDDVFLDTTAAYARNQYDSTRHVTVGAVNRTARGDFDGNQFSVKAKLGRNYVMQNTMTVRPYLGLTYSHLELDGYTETGAGTANLTVRAEDYDTVSAQLGASVSWTRESKGVRYVPELHAAVTHELGDVRQVNTASFAAGGAAFTTEGADPARTGLNLGASLGIFSKDNLDIRASYDFDYKSDYQAHAGSVVARFTF